MSMDIVREPGTASARGGDRKIRVLVNLVARVLKHEVCEPLGAAGGLGHSVAREFVERSGEDGAYVKLPHEVDDVDGERISCRRS
jgi:hypothetical protein